jgi:hypothetical protein
VTVAFEFNGKSYLLPQGLLLGENLRGYATGGYPDTVRMIDGLEGVAEDWLGGALDLANMIEAVLTGAQVEAVRLTGRVADAAYAALLPIVHSADPSDEPPGASALLDALRARLTD